MLEIKIISTGIKKEELIWEEKEKINKMNAKIIISLVEKDFVIMLTENQLNLYN